MSYLAVEGIDGSALLAMEIYGGRKVLSGMFFVGGMGSMLIEVISASGCQITCQLNKHWHLCLLGSLVWSCTVNSAQILW